MASGEEERISRILAGDGSAFAELVREFHPLAYGLAYRVLLDPEDAEEVVQDAFAGQLPGQFLVKNLDPAHRPASQSQSTP